MDSKLRRTAILSSMAVILLVSFLVWNANNKNGNSAQGGQQPSQATEPPADGAANGQNNGQSGSQNSNQIGNDLSAFLRDPTFFDPETDPVLDALKNNINRLSLVATSVEKDLRIQIVNGDGTPVAGESFVVELEGAGQFEDLDKDGVIYIGGLEAGDYSVKLLPAEGYQTPDGGMKVRVKGKVEYLAIEDISLLIKAEEDIEAGIEDVTVKDALTDADGTEIQRLQKVAGAKNRRFRAQRGNRLEKSQRRRGGICHYPRRLSRLRHGLPGGGPLFSGKYEGRRSKRHICGRVLFHSGGKRGGGGGGGVRGAGADS